MGWFQSRPELPSLLEMEISQNKKPLVKASPELYRYLKVTLAILKTCPHELLMPR